MGSNQRRRDQEYREQPNLFDLPDHDVVDHGKQARNETFQQISDELPERQRVWHSRIVAAGASGVTLDELSRQYDLPPNAFSGRVTELQQRGLVVRTKERRKTKSGKNASVIVARCWLDKPQPNLPNSHRPQQKEEETMDSMPDSVTCPETPRDQRDEQIKPGIVYELSRPGDKPVRVRVSEDPATGDLYYTPLGTKSHQRVDQSDPRATWRFL